MPPHGWLHDIRDKAATAFLTTQNGSWSRSAGITFFAEQPDRAHQIDLGQIGNALPFTLLLRDALDWSEHGLGAGVSRPLAAGGSATRARVDRGGQARADDRRRRLKEEASTDCPISRFLRRVLGAPPDSGTVFCGAAGRADIAKDASPGSKLDFCACAAK